MNVELVYNGLTLGAAPYALTELLGLWESPEVRTSDMLRARGHGQWPGVDLLGGRSIMATVQLTAPDLNGGVLAAFSSALRPAVGDELPLRVTVDGLAGGRALQVGARVRRLALPVDVERYQFGFPLANVEWWATDPRMYDTSETSLSTSVQSPSGVGLTFDVEFDLEFGGPIPSGVVQASNVGNFPAPWSVSMTGPLTDPRVENIATGDALRFVGSVEAGQVFTVDSLTRQATLDGASRYSWLTPGSSWFDLAPGVSDVRLAATAGDGTGTLTFRSAWI